MNPKITLILSLLVGGAVHFGANAATLIVDNDVSHVAPEGSTIYRTAQSAHDAATAGDTLIFMGSSVSYGSLTIEKPLKLIGPGYDLAHNFPSKNTDLRSVSLDSMDIKNGVAPGIDIHGIVFSGLVSQNSLGGTHNVAFTSCKFVRDLQVSPNSASSSQCNNWIFRKCYFTNLFQIGSNCHGWLISNSIFHHTSRMTVHNSTFANSTILNIQDDSLDLTSCFFDLCILSYSNSSPSNFSFVNTNFSRCLSNFDLPGGSNLEMPGITERNTTWFAGGASLNNDSDFALTNWEGFSDPVFGGRQPGAFGGAAPYRLSGLPNVPVIMRATGESTVVQGNNLVLEVEVELAE